MAEKGDEAAGIGHNEVDRPEKLREWDAARRPVEERLRAAREELKAINKEYKQITGVTVTDFNAMRRLAHLEEDEDRHQKLSNMMLVYNSLNPGEQMDWLSSIEGND